MHLQADHQMSEPKQRRPYSHVPPPIRRDRASLTPQYLEHPQHERHAEQQRARVRGGHAQSKREILGFDQCEDQQAAGGTGHGQRQVMVQQPLLKGASIHDLGAHTNFKFAKDYQLGSPFPITFLSARIQKADFIRRGRLEPFRRKN